MPQKSFMIGLTTAFACAIGVLFAQVPVQQGQPGGGFPAGGFPGG